MDEEQLRRARGALLQDCRTSQGHVRVVVKNGGLALEGVVADLTERRAAIRVVRQALGERAVGDHLSIKQVPARTDEEIARHLWNSYQQDPVIDERQIGIHVQGGCVRLEGQVDSVVTRKLAGVIAWWNPGVSDVENRLTVKNSEEEGDVWILEAIDVVLDKDFLIDRGQVMFSCKNGVVRLTGSVPSPEVKRAAENDMWAIDGVVDVHNDLLVQARESSTEFR